MKLNPIEQRKFAVEVVRRLREAGHTAYWAGGCVRDLLLARTPKDFDVASDARPEQVRALFGERRTLAIGAAFGVIAVIGPREAGTVEVTTFRRDAEYRDGRRPEGVTFTDAEEDARRRDFTMNALFYDPQAETILDYVGGRDDIARRIVRAVGQARKRFDEDKLRMLRAVRMAATFGFTIEAETATAMIERADQVTVVSPERISQELHGMLGRPGQTEAARKLFELKLVDAVLPELASVATRAVPGLNGTIWDRTLGTLAELERDGQLSFPLSWAALLLEVGRDETDDNWQRRGAEIAKHVCRRLRMSNDERDRTAWLIAHQDGLHEARHRPWSQIQPQLAHAGGEDLVRLESARSRVLGRSNVDAAFCRERLAWQRPLLDPPPLLTGDDLVGLGMRPGKEFVALLQAVRDAQLDGRITTRDEAIELTGRLRTPN